MKDYPPNLEFHSERLEPTITYLIGMWYCRSKYNKDKWGHHSAAYVDSMQEWWWGMRKLSSVLVVCPGVTHANVAFSNTMQEVKRMIQSELDITFSFQDGDELNFRSLVKFNLEFPEFEEYHKLAQQADT